MRPRAAGAAPLGPRGGQVAHGGNGGPSECFDFLPGEPPRLPRQEVAEGEITDGNPLELLHLVTQGGKHSTDLPVPSFIEHHFEHGALLVLRADSDSLGMDSRFRQRHPLSQAFNRLLGRNASHLNEVAFFDAVARMRQEVAEFTVIGDENQSFAAAVEPADRKQPLVAGNQVDDPWAACRIKVGCDHADRFVEQVDNATGARQAFAIDTNLLPQWIDPGAEGRDHFTVNFHPPACDEFLTGSPAADAGGSEHLLEPFQTVIRSDWPDWWAAVVAGTSARRRTRGTARRTLGRARVCRGPGAARGWGHGQIFRVGGM